MLNSLATTATAGYLVGKGAAASNPVVQGNAAIHGYSGAFWWAAAIFAVGAVVCGLILRAGKPDPVDPDAAPPVHA